MRHAIAPKYIKIAVGAIENGVFGLKKPIEPAAGVKSSSDCPGMEPRSKSIGIMTYGVSQEVRLNG